MMRGQPHEATFTLPLAPSVNACYRHDPKSGRRVRTKALDEYQKEVKVYFLAQGVPHPAWTAAQELGYEAHIYVPTRASDCSNRLKAYENSMQEALGFNDNKFSDIHAIRHIDRQHPRIETRLFVVC